MQVIIGEKSTKKPTISKYEKKCQEERERLRQFQREVGGFLFDLGFNVVVKSDLHKR